MKGSGHLLTALNEKGYKVSLARPDQAKHLRSIHHFYCPICSEQVILKAGEIRIPHFAHRKNSDCHSGFSEPESYEHLQGKQQLNEYFLEQGFEVSLEHYLPKLKQRPDLLISKNGLQYAVEYQCSPISRSILQKRTDGYVRAGIRPFWIVGGLPYQKNKNHHFELAEFHFSMATRNREGPLSILSYHSLHKTVHLLSNIIPISSRKVFARLQTAPLNTLQFPLIFQKTNLNWSGTQWLSEKQKWLENKVRYGNIVNDSFLKAVYLSGHNPFLLPFVCGIPVAYMECIQNHPVEWQFFVWIDCLEKLEVGHRVSLKYAEQKIKARIERGDIVLRTFPLSSDISWKEALQHYFYNLAQLQYFIVEDNLFKVNKKIAVPNHTEEALKAEEMFYIGKTSRNYEENRE